MNGLKFSKDSKGNRSLKSIVDVGVKPRITYETKTQGVLGLISELMSFPQEFFASGVMVNYREMREEYRYSNEEIHAIESVVEKLTLVCSQSSRRENIIRHLKNNLNGYNL